MFVTANRCTIIERNNTKNAPILHMPNSTGALSQEKEPRRGTIYITKEMNVMLLYHIYLQISIGGVQ